MTPPVFGHGELRLVLLTLVGERPRHGYELIQALTDHFGGGYSPSAGTIYPRLSKLEQEGLVSKREEGRKTVYAITDAGRREVDERREEFDRITVDSTATLSSVADEARTGLAEARSGLREELGRIAADARAAAEAAAEATAAKASGEPGPRPAPAEPADAAGSDGGADGAAAEPTGEARFAAAGIDDERLRSGEAGDAGDAAPADDSTDAAAGPARTPRDELRDAAEAAREAGERAAAAAAGAAASAAEAAEAAAQRLAAAARRFGGPATDHRAFDLPVDAFDDPNAELLRRVDAAVQRFRMNLRHDAREGARGGVLDADAVDALESELARAGRDFAARLGIHR